MKKILLVEPGYKNKYPPMGLMKISTYHKTLGDEVTFVKGIDSNIEKYVWDRIYVTTLFTFDFDIDVKTINYYKMLIDDIEQFFVGGIMSSLMSEKLKEATGLTDYNILIGLFTNTVVVGDHNDINIDQLPLDYDIIDQIDYQYPAGDNYFGYTTRGCPNHCPFCAVPILEPEFLVTDNIVNQIHYIDEKYGPKQNLLLLDNNVLNTPNLEQLVNDLCTAGFEKGAKFEDPGTYSIVMRRYHRGDRGAFLDKKIKAYLEKIKSKVKSEMQREKYLEILINGEDSEDYAEYMLQVEADLSPIIEKYRSKAKKARYIDFNQGVDGRRINDENMELLSRLAIKPLRIAFDDIHMKDKFCEAVETAYRHGIREISNYMLFNFKDEPRHLYERLQVNIELNKKLGIQIFSFPMKYCPVSYTDRSYVGEHWKVKYLRAISAILQVTKGVVAAGSDFFYKAFGKDIDEYMELLAMPREFIMFRSYFEENGQTAKWRELYRQLNMEQHDRLMDIVSQTAAEIREICWPDDLKVIIPYYLVKYHPSQEEAVDEEQTTLFGQD